MLKQVVNLYRYISLLVMIYFPYPSYLHVWCYCFDIFFTQWWRWIYLVNRLLHCNPNFCFLL